MGAGARQQLFNAAEKLQASVVQGPKGGELRTFAVQYDAESEGTEEKKLLKDMEAAG